MQKAENYLSYLFLSQRYEHMYSFMDKAPKPDRSCCLSDGVIDKAELEVNATVPVFSRVTILSQRKPRTTAH